MNVLPRNTLFVTGTDTSVGKTYFCARFLEFLSEQGVQAGYQKWVATGTADGLPEDLAVCLQAAGTLPAPEQIGQHVPYSFKFPASPHFAAELEGGTIAPEIIVENYRKLAARYEWLIVEGVGGLMVPLRRDLLLADLLAELQPLTLVVARSGLGTLNHTLLTLEALRSRRIPVLGVVFSDSETEEDEKLLHDNMRTIEKTGGVRVFGRLRRLRYSAAAADAFAPVGQAILNNLRHVL